MKSSSSRAQISADCRSKLIHVTTCWRDCCMALVRRFEWESRAKPVSREGYNPHHRSEASVANRKTHSMKDNEIAPRPDIDPDVWFPPRHPIPTSCLKRQ